MAIIVPPSALSVSDPGPDTPTSVYRYYDAHDLLLYVGITSRGITRNREHNTTKDWWPFVVRQEVDHFDTRAEALIRERSLIFRHRPPFNIQHNPGSAEVREAYFALATARDAVDPVALVKQLDRKLPLTAATVHGEWKYTFRTHPAHASVASRLTLPGKRVATEVKHRQYAYVTDMEIGLLCTVIKVKSMVPLRTDGVSVRVRMTKSKDPDYRVHSLALRAVV